MGVERYLMGDLRHQNRTSVDFVTRDPVFLSSSIIQQHPRGDAFYTRLVINQREIQGNIKVKDIQ